MAGRGRSVNGKVVLITGAARGIGAGVAKGARVALIGLEPDELNAVAKQCGPEAAAWEADVTSWAYSTAKAGVRRWGLGVGLAPLPPAGRKGARSESTRAAESPSTRTAL